MLSNLKKLLLRLWNFLKFVLGWLWRISIPLLLTAMVLLPIFLTFFQAPKKANTLLKGVPVAKADVIKKIQVTATVEHDYSYDLPVYQDADLKEVLVKTGDTVKAGQTLANLEFVNETKIRGTVAQNQINTYNQEIANNNRALGDIAKVNTANISLLDTKLQNLYTEYNELVQRKDDKVSELAGKKNRYETEKRDLESQFDDLENAKDINDAINTYEDKIDTLRRQRDTTTPSGTVLQTQGQANTQKTSADAASKAYTSQCPNGVPTAPATQATCDQLYATFKTASDSFNNANAQASNASNLNNNSVSDLNSQINDLQSKVNRLKNIGIPGNLAMTDITKDITDQANNSRLESEKQEIKSDITSRKTYIKQIEDNVEVKTLNEQILAKDKMIRENEAQQGLTKSQLDQTLSTTQQRNAAAQVNVQGAQQTLADNQEDMAKQAKNRTIVAKKDGVIGQVVKEQGLAANARDVVFKVVSESYRLKFNVSADNRAMLKKDLKIAVTTPKYKGLQDVKITEANMVPNTTTTATGTAVAASNPEYSVYASLPKSELVYSQGESVEADVIIDERKATISVPSAAVDNGKVLVGLGAVEQADTKQDNKPVISFGGISNEPAKPKTYKFREVKEVEVEAGLDDGKNVEIKKGLNEGDFVFNIFPKTQEDKQIVVNDSIVK